MSLFGSEPTVSLRPKALIFDLMGTCLDWHSSITPVLRRALKSVGFPQSQPVLSDEQASKLALEWRQSFFDDIHMHFKAGHPPEDIDRTHYRTLSWLVQQERWGLDKGMGVLGVGECVAAWHTQRGRSVVFPF